MRAVQIAAVIALGAGMAHAQTPPAHTSDDLVRAFQQAPCPEGDTRDAEGACSHTRGFRLLDTPTSPTTPTAHSPAAGHSPRAHGPAAAPAPPASSPLSDLRISFALGSAELDAAGRAQAEALAQAWRDPRLAGLRLEIAGHTDASGSADRNLALSKARAHTVVTFLQADGVDASRLTADGFGSGQPLYPNRPYDGANRRVEARVLN